MTPPQLRPPSARTPAPRRPRLVVAPDKFRGTASAAEVVATVVEVAEAGGWSARGVRMADGGEGTLAALGGEPRFDLVSGPLGAPTLAEWRLFDPGPIAGLAVPDLSGRPRTPHTAALVEVAQCAGLALAGGAARNDPLAASTAGVGQLIAAAVAAGAAQVVVACGGSASTDGGLGALEALGFPPGLGPVDLVVAYDVDTCFVDAATAFAPQKGATPAQVHFLRNRLVQLAALYQERLGVDVRHLEGGGAAGGLAGGLAAMGARLVSGFSLVAGATGLPGALAAAELVVTGEGYLDAQSLHGKVVGGVLGLASAAGVPALVVVGGADPKAARQVQGANVSVVSLSATFGRERALSDPLGAIASVVAQHLAQVLPDSR